MGAWLQARTFCVGPVKCWTLWIWMCKRKAWLALRLLGKSFQGSVVESHRTIQFVHLFFCLIGKKTPVEGIFHPPPCQAPLVSSTPVKMQVDGLWWVVSLTVTCPSQQRSENGVHWIAFLSRGQNLGYLECVVSVVKCSPSEVDTLINYGSITLVQLL